MLIHPIKLIKIDKELVVGRLAQGCFLIFIVVIFIGEVLFFEFPDAVKKLFRSPR